MYSAKEPIAPFWSENGGFIRGRDPLGIQNSSITVYGRLLPGMTNLTGRIRYYSFYCWLLDEYDRLPSGIEKENHFAQYRFIRRAELLMAFLMIIKEPNVTNVPGSNYATRHKADDTYSLIDGADKPGKELYWDYSSGALGQYYAGSLITLGLIELTKGYFLIKPDGRKLAEAFRSSVPTRERDYFLEIIRKGSSVLGDFDKIMSFRLTAINTSGKEWLLLRDILLGEDGANFITRDGNSSSKRVQTIKLYLEFKSAEDPIYEFPLWVFNGISQDTDPNSSKFGWFYYYLNEAVHYALSSVFWAFLFNINGAIQEFHSYLENFESKILEDSESILGFNGEDTLSTIVGSIEMKSIPDKLSEIKNAVKKEKSYTAVCESLSMLFLIYNFIQPYKEPIKAFEINNYIDYQKGNLSEHLHLYVEKNLGASYREYVDRVVKTLINDHMDTAYRKMGNGDANLLKFLIEDHCIIHIETIEPRGTTPRIQSLHNFILDLGLIDTEEKLTELGSDLLDRL